MLPWTQDADGLDAALLCCPSLQRLLTLKAVRLTSTAAALFLRPNPAETKADAAVATANAYAELTLLTTLAMHSLLVVLWSTETVNYQVL